MKPFELKLGYGQYAIIEKDSHVTYYQGKVHELETLDELDELRKKSDKPVVFMNPFRTAREKGFEARGDEPILALVATGVLTGTRNDIREILEEVPVELEGGIAPSVSDEEYAELVREVQANEIEQGNATQVILSRRFQGLIKKMQPETLHTLFKRLLQFRGQYMTVLFSDEEHHFVGATPERHIEMNAESNEVIMNPIAGTLKKLDRKTFETRLKEFLKDKKEINELFQVLDEELKMMARICPVGGKIEGPFLRESGAVIHTEYRLVGEAGVEPIEAFRISLHAPTLVGGPEESAMRIIRTYEPESRRYYGGEIGVIDQKGNLDSAIYIRTAELDNHGQFNVQAGAGIVRDSVPEKEAEETRAKSHGFTNVLTGQGGAEMGFLESLSDRVQGEIAEIADERNVDLSAFHFNLQSEPKQLEILKGKTVTIVNNEDDFAYMIAHMAAHMGCEVKVVDTFEFDSDNNVSDIVLLGPGPGNINDPNNKRMVKLLDHVAKLRERQASVMGVCLGHQAIAKVAGMQVERLPKTNQGMQRIVKLFDQKLERLGFYNSFGVRPISAPEDYELSVDRLGQVVGMKASDMVSFAFHPESVMSENGYQIMQDHLVHLIHHQKKA